MVDVRYVVFSDMHLGAENSLLTNLSRSNQTETDNMEPSPVLVQMIACLKEVIAKNEGSKKPTLVLNGDIIELALTTTNNAVMAFERFVELVMPADGDFLFDSEVLYLSGNHDHNLWERSRNHHYFQYLSSLKAGDFVQDELHTTSLFTPEDITTPFLESVFHRHAHLQQINVRAVYPAFGVMSEDQRKCVVISHGHYVESMYSLMSTLRTKIFPDREHPTTFEILEQENYAWVDFFWSTLGRSGSVGKDLNLIYDKLQDSEQVKIMIENLAESLVDGKKNMLVKWVEEKVLQEILTLTLGRMAASERNEPDVVLTPDATAGLKLYLERYLMAQIRQELKGILPESLTFIFGHTHKPFQMEENYEGYPRAVKVFNGGGWVVDTMHQQPLHGGSVILIDEHLDVVALQMYKEGKNAVTVEDVTDDENKTCDFHRRISQDIRLDQDPWKSFAQVADAEIKIRYSNLAEIAKGNN